MLTNESSERLCRKRYYGGRVFTDIVETLALNRAKKLFGQEHANVQPHWGAQANLAVYAALLEPGDASAWVLLHIVTPDTWASGDSAGKVYRFVRYQTEADGSIDYDKLEILAKKKKRNFCRWIFLVYSANRLCPFCCYW